MSKTFECPACGLEVEGRPEVCPYCGYEFPERPKSVSAVAWLMALLLLIPVIWVLSRLL
jgi:hypothetical protein